MNTTSDVQNLSLMLSEVMDDIGVNERIVMERRFAIVLKEVVLRVLFKIQHEHETARFFGSSIEGTTTLRLKSDVDFVCCDDRVNVIKDMTEWTPGVGNLLMIQDDTVTTGYCLLRLLRQDVPLPITEVMNGYQVKDRKGRVLLKNSFPIYDLLDMMERHGPALTLYGTYSYFKLDTVYAFRCKSLPCPVKEWLDRPTLGEWPSDNIKNQIKNSACYVVPVGCKGSANEELEWRISTSEAERCLMLSLNMTQIRTYVLMKMLLKCKINCNIPDDNAVSSYMCKTVLLHCVESSNNDQWENQNLLACLKSCLTELRSCVSLENCPHFIINKNNLMAGKFTDEAKCQLLKNIDTILSDLVRDGILAIDIENVRLRMGLKMRRQNFYTDDVAIRWLMFQCSSVRKLLLYGLLFSCRYILKTVISVNILNRYEAALKQVMSEGNVQERSASEFLITMFYTVIGSVLASLSLHASNTVSPRAIVYLSLGATTDATSGRLKLASVYYCAGDMEKCETLLKDVERQYASSVCDTFCECNFTYEGNHVPIRPRAYKDHHDIEKLIASCVLYAPEELAPKELHFEIFKSTEKEIQLNIRQFLRNITLQFINCAAVDSITYLHFLQYKIYSRLHRHEDRQRALNNLALRIDNDPNLGHRETALNLLGQCMEQENRHETAFQCYYLSLKVHPRNNAARVHICRLLNKEINF